MITVGFNRFITVWMGLTSCMGEFVPAMVRMIWMKLRFCKSECVMMTVGLLLWNDFDVMIIVEKGFARGVQGRRQGGLWGMQPPPPH